MKQLISFLTRNIPRKHLQLFGNFATRMLSVLYLGKNVSCPICGNSYRKFMPYGRIQARSNALCPNCLSLERHRLIWCYLKEKTPFFSKKYRVLHIAPEFCFIKRFDRMENLEYITADLESPLAKVKMDVQNIPFQNNYFDVILCNHIMEHVEDDLKAMGELYRILKPEGWGIIQSPINPGRKETYEDKNITSEKEREKHGGQQDHVREYGLDYPERLKKAGFKVKTDNFVKEIDRDIAKKYSLPAEEVIYFVSK